MLYKKTLFSLIITYNEYNTLKGNKAVYWIANVYMEN